MSRLRRMVWVNESVVFQYTFVSNGGLIFPQEAVEHDQVGGNFKEVCKEVIYMDVWAMLEEIKTVVLEDT